MDFVQVYTYSKQVEDFHCGCRTPHTTLQMNKKVITEKRHSYQEDYLKKIIIDPQCIGVFYD